MKNHDLYIEADALALAVRGGDISLRDQLAILIHKEALRSVKGDIDFRSDVAVEVLRRFLHGPALNTWDSARGHFSPFVCGVAKLTAINLRRQRAKRNSDGENELPLTVEHEWIPAPRKADPVEQREVMEVMPEDEREIVAMLLAGKTHEEIRAALGIAPRTYFRKIARIRERAERYHQGKHPNGPSKT